MVKPKNILTFYYQKNNIMNFDELKFSLIQELINRSLSVEQLNRIKENLDEVTTTQDNKTTKKGIVEFTPKEINTMPKNIKRLLLLDKKRCRLRTHPSGKNSVTYEIRFRRDGYDISASGKTIELAKANFLNKCKAAAIKESNAPCSVPTKFDGFSQFYFENFRKEKVTAATYRTDITRYNRYLLPKFKQTPIKNITPSDCKKIIDDVKEQGKGKTADELHSLLNVIFKSAIAHGIIERNPLDTVLHIQHERKSGKALTKEEEQRLKIALTGSKYLNPIMLLLYTGLRPNELKTAKIDGDFIIAENSKRKNKKVAYKKIPIIKALRPFLSVPLFSPTLDTLRRNFNQVMPNHILYDLRNTFYTRCDEFNVSAAARDEFVGHSNGALTNTYRNLSDEYLLEESKKLDKWL